MFRSMRSAESMVLPVKTRGFQMKRYFKRNLKLWVQMSSNRQQGVMQVKKIMDTGGCTSDPCVTNY